MRKILRFVYSFLLFLTFFSCKNYQNNASENKSFECDYVYEKCFEVDGYSVYSFVKRGYRIEHYIAIPVVQEKSASCLVCGNDVYKTDMFCSNCGKPLRGL